MPQVISDALLASLNVEYPRRDDVFFSLANIISTELNATGLLAYWPMATVNNFGSGYATIDASANTVQLFNINTPTFEVDGMASYVQITSVGLNQLSAADAANLDITGIEPGIGTALKGFTIKTWLYFDNTGVNVIPWSKLTLPADQSWMIQRQANDTLRFVISGDGTNTNTVDTVAVMPANEWIFVACTFNPGNEIAIQVKSDSKGPAPVDERQTSPTAIASLFNSVSAVVVGGINGGTLFPFDGRVSHTSLLRVNQPRYLINNFLEQSRILLGVT